MRFLYTSPTPIISATAGPSPAPITDDSNIVVVLAALLCALICVVGLALVTRCAWLRRSTDPAKLPSVKGLSKKALRLLPTVNFEASSAAFEKMMQCPICLEKFSEGEEIRILAGCGHGFHVGCVDRWLGTHSSCPSCRRVLVVAPVRCKKCGASSAAEEEEAKVREDRFLP